MNIVLIGFMGSGKTTVGKALANNLKFSFLDTDEYIEERAGMKISDIFATQGEKYFRELERSILGELTDRDHTVIATGGGLPLIEENRKRLKKIGKIIYLSANEQTLWKHLEGDCSRPLLAGENPRKKIQELLLERIPIYRQASDYCIEVDNRCIDEISKEIEKIVKSA